MRNGDGWWRCGGLSEGTAGTIGCGLDLGDCQGDSIVIVESWGFLVAIGFELDAIKVEEVKEVAVSISIGDAQPHRRFASCHVRAC